MTSGAALEEGLGDPTNTERSAHTVAAFCEICGIGRIGRLPRVLRWAERHHAHTEHVVPVRPWNAS